MNGRSVRLTEGSVSVTENDEIIFENGISCEMFA
jgi:hypothetical protein